jgi:hypothetical protein
MSKAGEEPQNGHTNEYYLAILQLLSPVSQIGQHTDGRRPLHSDYDKRDSLELEKACTREVFCAF